MNTIMKFVDVHKSFMNGSEKLEVLKGISGELKSGEMLCVTGASGSGKSTLLHVLAGLTTCDLGNIFINKENISDYSDAKISLFRAKHLGIIFQSFNLIPNLNVRENILLPLLLSKEKINKEHFEKLVKKLGIENKLLVLPEKLSGGEQQRVAIARALINQPKLIFADEPTGNLDSQNSEIIFNLLRDLCKEQQVGLILVTHDITLAKKGDRILHINDGVEFPYE